MKSRIGFYSALPVGLFYIGFLVYAFLVQLTPFGDRYRRIGSKVKVPITINGERGIFFDRNGNPLAVNVPSIELYKTEKTLSKSTISLLMNSNKKNVDLYTKNIYNNKPYSKIATFKFYHDTIQEFSKSKEVIQRFGTGRYYIYGEAFAPLLGCLGEDEMPLGGLELTLNDYIKGKPGVIYYLRDAIGNYSKLNEKNDIPAKPGKSAILTINATLQEYCYEVLKKRIEETSAEKGFVIVTNPQTGEILALASYPANDPNKKIPSKNLAVEDPFEPGSTFKLVTYVSALENKEIFLDDSIDAENGKFKVANHTIYDEHPHSILSIREAFAYSSNVVAAKIGLKLGAYKLFKTAQKFGFGCPTGINLPGESSPSLLKPSKWSMSRTANFAYGYGVMVNGIQMAMAYGAVANGGYLLMPKIIKNGKPIVVRKVMSEGLADTLKEMLREVVKSGTGKKADIPGIEICGKTGTAKRLDPATGSYSSNAMTSSFIGFFPKDNPKYLIYIVIFDPKGPLYARYGGEVAAPLFRRIAEFLVGGENAVVRAGARSENSR